MIEKKFIHFNTLENFQLNIDNILPTSIVFIKDAKLIYTHGSYYNCSEDTLSDSYATSTLLSEPVAGDTTENAISKLHKQINSLNTDVLSNGQYISEILGLIYGTEVGDMDLNPDDVVHYDGILDQISTLKTNQTTLRTSVGLSSDLLYTPVSLEFSGMNMTEAIDSLADHIALVDDDVVDMQERMRMKAETSSVFLPEDYTASASTTYPQARDSVIEAVNKLHNVVLNNESNCITSSNYSNYITLDYVNNLNITASSIGSHSLWGQTFDGTLDVTGDIESTGVIHGDFLIADSGIGLGQGDLAIDTGDISISTGNIVLSHGSLDCTWVNSNDTEAVFISQSASGPLPPMTELLVPNYHIRHIVIHNTSSSPISLAIPSTEDLISYSGDVVSIGPDEYSEISVLNANGTFLLRIL